MAFAALSAATLGCAAAKKGPLDREVVPRAVAESGANELAPVCAAADMPCGWELVPSDAGRLSEAVPNDRESGTPRQFLDGLVQRHPVYRWFMSPDKKVINVAPRKIGANDPLDRQVWVDLDGVTADKALAELVRSAGLKLVAPPESPDLYGEAARGTRVSLKAKGLRLRIALNRLVASDGRSMWWCASTLDPEELRCSVTSWGNGRAY